jgi:hypothetical protein
MTQAITNKKPPYLLMYIVTLVYLVVTAFFEEGVAYFDPVYTTLMSSTEFYLTFSLCAVLFLTVIYIAKYYFGIRINWVFFSLVVLLFLIDVVAILSFPEWTVLTGVYHVTASLRLRYITFWLAACMAFYVFFAIMPKSVISVNGWSVYFVFAVFIAFSSCVYSYFAEPSVYLYFIDPKSNLFLYTGPVSFTNNRNTYATLLLVGLLSSFYLFSKSRKWYWPILGFFFFVNIVLTLSKTVILSSAVFIFLFIFFDYIFHIRNHTVIRSILMLFFVIIVAMPFFLRSFNNSSDDGLLFKINKYLTFLFDFSSNYSLAWSIDGRVNVWSDIIQSMVRRPVSLIFGLGDWNFSWFLGFLVSGSSSYIESAHSGFFDVFGRSGIIGIALYLSLLIFFVYKCIKNFKNDKPSTIVSLLIFAAFLFHGLSEDTNFLNMQAKDMMVSFMVFIPVLTNDFSSVKQTKANEFETEYSSAHRQNQASLSKGMILLDVLYFVSISVLLPLIGLSEFMSHWGGLAFIDTVNFQLLATVAIFISPVIIFALFFQSKFGSKKRFNLLLIVDITWLIMLIFAACFISNVFLISVCALAGIIVLVLSLKKLGEYRKKALSTIAFCFCYFIVFAILSKTIVHFCLVSSQSYQPYACMCLVLLYLFSFILLIIFDNKNRHFAWLHSLWFAVEAYCLYISYFYIVKDQVKKIRVNQKIIF